MAQLRPLWQPSRPYLNTASFGLPPRPTWEALLGDWRAGRTSWEHWGESTEGARAAFARLVGAEPEGVAVGASVAELVGLIAAALPEPASRRRCAAAACAPPFTSTTPMTTWTRRWRHYTSAHKPGGLAGKRAEIAPST
ncbi:MAG: hypothetical protein ACRDL4_11005 [Thermoleophilaceae bacterium]